MYRIVMWTKTAPVQGLREIIVNAPSKCYCDVKFSMDGMQQYRRYRLLTIVSIIKAVPTKARTDKNVPTTFSDYRLFLLFFQKNIPDTGNIQ